MTKAHYPIPASPAQTEIVVRGSRFIAQAIPTPTVEAARAAIAATRAAMPDATHHCYAYLIGYGSSTIAGMVMMVNQRGVPVDQCCLCCAVPIWVTSRLL